MGEFEMSESGRSDGGTFFRDQEGAALLRRILASRKSGRYIFSPREDRRSRERSEKVKPETVIKARGIEACDRIRDRAQQSC